MPMKRPINPAELIEVLWSLSPKTYALLARMIVATAQAEAIRDQRRQIFRNSRRLLKQRAEEKGALESRVPARTLVFQRRERKNDIERDSGATCEAKVDR